MNTNELLSLIGEAREKYVLEAGKTRRKARRLLPLNRVALIAAAVAVMLLLAGCAAVIVMTLQDRKVGELTYTQNFDAYGNTVPATEKTLNIASMSGFGGSPAQLASQEWNDFCRNYEPEALSNDPDLPDIPNNYEYSYQCYDQTMVNKLNEIAEKYDLKLLGTRAVAQRWQREAAFQELGIQSLTRSGAPAQVEYGACRLYPPRNFICDVLLTLTGEDAAWTEQVYSEVYYLQSGYLAHHDAFTYDPETTQEWEYTTASGMKVLLALSGTQGTILAQREDSTIVVRMDMDWTQPGVFLKEGYVFPTPQALEQLADCFDFQITTQEVPMEGMQAKFDAIPDPNAMDPADLQPETYASFADFVKTVQYPEYQDYAFWDIDGDGVEEFLLGTQDGRFEECQTIRDGKVQRYFWGGPWQLMEGGILDFSQSNGNSHQYIKLGGPDPEIGIEMELLEYVELREGTWKYSKAGADLMTDITETQAREIMAKYVPVELNWQPLMDFPMDETRTTLGDQLRSEGTLKGQALLDFYAENYPRDYWAGELRWFALRDLDGDGIDDLLLSMDGEKIDLAYRYRWGNLQEIGMEFYLCKDGVREACSRIEAITLGIVESHDFLLVQGTRWEILDTLHHNLSTDTWYYDMWDSNAISEAEAQAILAKYPREKLDMKPISELAGN